MFIWGEMMRLREFQPKDRYSVMRLTEQAFHDSYDSSLFLEFHNSWREGFIVIESFWHVIGFAIATRLSRDEARLLMLAVDEKHRRRGIGSALMGEIIKQATLIGMKKIRLEVKVSNKDAIRFYTRFGFVIVSRLSNYYNNSEDGFLMIL